MRFLYRRPEPINTIEFRQHHETVHAEEIGAWVQVAAGLVRRAFDADAKERCVNLVADAGKGRFTFVDFLKEIRKEHLVDFYRMRQDCL